jgi:hypothetical protein
MPMRVIDIAHPPMRGADAEPHLDEHLRDLRSRGPGWALKVIHGHGGPGVLRETVRNWGWMNRSRLCGIIEGERYEITDRTTLAMRTACGQNPDGDLGHANRGITIFWIT